MGQVTLADNNGHCVMRRKRRRSSGSQHEGYSLQLTDGFVLLENDCRSHRIETRYCNRTSRDTEESSGGRTALSVAQTQRSMGSFMGISTWCLRIKQKCWCAVALLVSLVQTRTFATGKLPATPVERTMWCRGGKKTASDISVSLFSTCLPSHLEGVKQHLGGKRWMLCTKWTDGLLMSLPTRCMLVLILYLIDRLGRPRAQEPHDLIGTVGAGVEGDSATRFGALLRRHSIAVPQTFHLATPTFLWFERTITNRFCCHTPFCAILAHLCQFQAGRRLQLIPVAAFVTTCR